MKRGHTDFGLVLCALLMISGCIAVPYPTSKDPLPFADDEVAQIVPGHTSRDDVIASYGEPFALRSDRSLALYGRSRQVGGLFVISRNNPDVLNPIESGHLLLLRFDEKDTVREVEAFSLGATRLRSEVCAADGICIRSRFAEKTNTNERSSLLAGAYFYDTPDNDAAARSFEVPPDRCALYIYYEPNMHDDDMRVFDAGNQAHDMQIEKSGYLLWLREPGLVTVGAHFRLNSFGFWTASYPSGARIESTLPFACTAGTRHYVRIRMGMGQTKPVILIAVEDPGKGLKALKQRRLMLDL